MGDTEKMGGTNMKKICLLTIWMGKLPESFWLWMITAKKNPTVDFFVITDNKGLVDNENVHFINMTMKSMKERFEQIVGFPVKLESPYKICDYRPLFGKAFSEILQPYEFWGQCDIDLIFGNISKFITDEILEQYDKILDAGCFVLYRNCETMNNLYERSMEKDNMAYPYEKAFRTQFACYFDEYMGMSILGWKYCRVFRDQLEEKVVQDFSWQRLNFQSYISDDSFLFQWKDGRLYRHMCDKEGKILLGQEPVECMLAHIQNRNMEHTITSQEVLQKKEFWIVPNKYQLEKPEGELYSSLERQVYMELIQKKDRQRSIKNLKSYGLLDYILHFIRSRRIRKWIIEEKKFF